MLKHNISFVVFLAFLPAVIPDTVDLSLDSLIIVNCSNDEELSITNISIIQKATTCAEKSCNETHILENIRNTCDGKSSCNISDTMIDGCLQEYGYVDFSYRCKVNAFSCKFEESSKCIWYVEPNANEDRYKWERRRGSTPSYRTGPSTDHSTYADNGYYFYADASRRNVDDKTFLKSGWVEPNYDQCLSFWYHMYGENIGTLTVYQTTDNINLNHLWNISFDQGNVWRNKMLYLTEKSTPFKLVFEATRGNGYYGDIAIDDVVITNTQCNVFIYNCDFETNCLWTSSAFENDYTWTLHTGETITDRTGPSFDHTRHSYKGHYMYLEASRIEQGSTANLTSPRFSLPSISCFSFWYHMYGSEIGQLAVYLDTNNNSELAWSKSGNQRNVWLQAFVDVTAAQGLKVTLTGIRNGNIGDIAVDDLMFVNGSCSGFIGGKNTCLQTDIPIQPRECTNHYVDFNQYNLTFQPYLDECGEIYQQLQPNFRETCLHSNRTECSFNISDALDRRPDCFALNTITVHYSCEAKYSVNSHLLTHSKPQIPAIIGSTIGSVLLIICIVILIFLFFKRFRNTISKTGLQNSNGEMNRNRGHPNAISSVLYNVVGSDTELYYPYANISTTETNLTNNERESNVLDIITRTTLEVDENNHPNDEVGRKTPLSDALNLKKSGGIDQVAYANYNPSELKSDMALCVEKSADSNFALEQNRTGSQNFNIYELASVTDICKAQDTVDGEDINDPYVITKNGTYDTSTNIVRKGVDENVYNHAVDSVYDTATHKRHDTGEETYDHFIPA